MKGLSECYSYLNYDSIDDEWYFADAENGPIVGTHHTARSLKMLALVKCLTVHCLKLRRWNKWKI